MIDNASGAETAKTWKSRATKKTPATTIVAAWINADTGVGPSIASGSQICKGNIADLPAPPANTSSNAHESVDNPIKVVDVNPARYGEPVAVNRSINTK